MVDVMIIGLGGTGSWALELLARMPDVERILACDVRDQSKLIATAVSGANHLGFYPDVRFERVDVSDMDSTAALINSTEPVVILNCTALMPWYGRKLLKLPPEKSKLLKRAGAAAWLPTHLCMARRVMLAVRESGVSTQVINLSFPDAVNASLHRQGLGPVMGAGNADLIIPNLRRGVARKIGGHARDVQVLMVAHHALTGIKHGDTEESMPYLVQVLHDGRDITAETPVHELVIRAAETRLPGALMNSLVASSMVKNAAAILHDTHLLTFAPGPRGLIGGYPVEIARDSTEVVLPSGVAMEEAVTLNERAQVEDGIERILDDGTVVLTQDAYRSMKRVTGYDIPSFHPEDSCERAMQLLEVFRELKSQYGMRGHEG